MFCQTGGPILRLLLFLLHLILGLYVTQGAAFMVSEGWSEFAISKDINLIGDRSLVANVEGRTGKVGSLIVTEGKTSRMERLLMLSIEGHALSSKSTRELRQRLVEVTKISNERILIAGSLSSHSVPTVPWLGSAEDELLVKAVSDAVVDASMKALQTVPTAVSLQIETEHELSVLRQNRWLREDGRIQWGLDAPSVVRPTGLVDEELHFIGFIEPENTMKAGFFVGTGRSGMIVEGDAFWSASKRMMDLHGGGVLPFRGAGADVRFKNGVDGVNRIVAGALHELIEGSAPVEGERIKTLKRKFEWQVRTFEEFTERAGVEIYSDLIGDKQRDALMDSLAQDRKTLVGQMGKTMHSDLQVIAIGELAIVALPCDLFSSLGMEIKNRSPYRNTIVICGANGWMGIIPDESAFHLGGFETWMGAHSFAERDTGKALVNQSIDMLIELSNSD